MPLGEQSGLCGCFDISAKLDCNKGSSVQRSSVKLSVFNVTNFMHEMLLRTMQLE